jgi:hypothetical protein
LEEFEFHEGIFVSVELALRMIRVADRIPIKTGRRTTVL